MLTSKRKEKISAFLDNDMHRDELMSFSLSAEAGDAAQAQRYQLVGEVLRGELDNASFVDVSHAVREALVDEYLAVEAPVAQSSPVQSSPETSRWNLSSLFRPVAGMAVAASVAVIMVVSFTQQENGGGAPLASNVGQQAVGQPTIVQLASQKSTSEGKTAVKPLTSIAVNYPTGDNAAKVNQRLVNQHLEFATQDTLQGRLPYVRAVSFETEK